MLYDGQCGLCREWSHRLRRWDRAGRIRQLPFQERGHVPGLPPLSDDALNQALHVVLPDGRVEIGARGVIALLPWLPGGAALGLLARIPGTAWVADRVYRGVARRRHGAGASNAACDQR